jgi:hypothetical protein
MNAYGGKAVEKKHESTTGLIHNTYTVVMRHMRLNPSIYIDSVGFRNVPNYGSEE